MSESPAPLRTTTPPLHQPHIHNHGHNHGHNHSHNHSHASSTDRTTTSTSLPSLQFDPPPLSPTDEAFDSFAEEDSSSRYMSPSSMLTPSSSSFSLSPQSAITGAGVSNIADEQARNPFSFQTQTYTAGKPPLKPSVGQRRGHKYKHSSISHQIFLEPTPRAPLRLPASLPIPSLRESYASMTRPQTLRLSFSLIHLAAAGLIQYASSGSLALTALSHLLFYDASAALLTTSTDVLANFDVWAQPSIRHPFGLARAELLAAFAMSILLLFMGFDLISHSAAHALETAGDHEPHHAHAHSSAGPAPARLLAAAALAAASTLAATLLFRARTSITRALRLSATVSLQGGPSHALTLLCAALLVPLSRVPLGSFVAWDRTLAAAMACCMCLLGYKLVAALGALLLMSYGDAAAGAPGGVDDLTRAISAAVGPAATVREARVWQVHHALAAANVRVDVGAATGVAELERVREVVEGVVRRGGHGGGGGVEGARWEVSVEIVCASPTT